MTGVERRGNWSDDEKLRILEEAATEGANIAEIARRHDIHAQQICTWRRRFSVKRDEPGGCVFACGVDRSRRRNQAGTCCVHG
ncbi:transposase [Rhizobium binae]|nr:transposase [Rhizobium binae]